MSKKEFSPHDLFAKLAAISGDTKTDDESIFDRDFGTPAPRGSVADQAPPVSRTNSGASVVFPDGVRRVRSSDSVFSEPPSAAASAEPSRTNSLRQRPGPPPARSAYPRGRSRMSAVVHDEDLAAAGESVEAYRPRRDRSPVFGRRYEEQAGPRRRESPGTKSDEDDLEAVRGVVERSKEVTNHGHRNILQRHVVNYTPPIEYGGGYGGLAGAAEPAAGEEPARSTSVTSDLTSRLLIRGNDRGGEAK